VCDFSWDFLGEENGVSFNQLHKFSFTKITAFVIVIVFVFVFVIVIVIVIVIVMIVAAGSNCRRRRVTRRHCRELSGPSPARAVELRANRIEHGLIAARLVD